MIQASRNRRLPATAPGLSIVIPVHNEEDNVAPLASEIHVALDGVIEYEIVFVDDGSTDATLDRLIDLASDDPAVRVLHHAASCGQSTALHTGVTQARAPLIATLDGDGQNDPADILNLVAAIEASGVDRTRTLVTGHRVTRRDSRLVRLSSRIANGVRSRILRDGTPDTGCGLKLFDRSLFLSLPYFDHMHRFLPALVRRAGGQVASVPVNHRPRASGRSHYGVHNRLWTGIVDLLGVMWLTRRVRLPDVVESIPGADSASSVLSDARAADSRRRVVSDVEVTSDVLRRGRHADA